MKKESYFDNSNSAFTLAMTLATAVKKVFYEKSGTRFSSEPELEKKVIIKYDERMRVDAMEKFNAPAVFSAVEFAADEDALKRQEYLLTLVLYLDRKFLPELLRLLQYPYIDFDDDQEVKDGCGTLVNLIGGQYKREMAVLGYVDSTMSPFKSYINSVGEGLDIPMGSKEKYEISFEVEGVKRVVVELAAPAELQRQLKCNIKPPKKILVIDDDRILVKMAKRLLQSEGFEVLVAGDGKEGLDRLKEKPHLIILDLQMPEMNGYEFILAMKGMTGLLGIPQVPVIILTAREGLENIVNVEGVREYLIKPLVPERLLNSIRRHI